MWLTIFSFIVGKIYEIFWKFHQFLYLTYLWKKIFFYFSKLKKKKMLNVKIVFPVHFTGFSKIVLFFYDYVWSLRISISIFNYKKKFLFKKCDFCVYRSDHFCWFISCTYVNTFRYKYTYYCLIVNFFSVLSEYKSDFIIIIASIDQLLLH